MSGNIITIPKLGIDSYFISADKELGYGTSFNGGNFQGVCINGEHYIIKTEDLNKGEVKDGKPIPRTAYLLNQIYSSGEAKVKEIKAQSVLERIAQEICDL